MKVAILTMFKGLSTTYSIVNVVAQQLQILLAHNIEVKLLVCEGCKRENGIFSDERIEWVPIINHMGEEEIIWHDYKSGDETLHPTFDKETEVIKEDFIKSLQDVQVCIMHDILYQGWHYVHNIAIRKAQKVLEDVKFIAFTHSFPYKRPREIKKEMLGLYTGMPQTTFVYPTYSGITPLACQYQIAEGSCKVVYNAFDVLEEVDESVKYLNEKSNLFTTEILVIYPCRMTPSKRLEKVAMLAGKIKQIKTIKIIFCDFPSQDIKSEAYKAYIMKQGMAYGLSKEDIVFTSDIGFLQGFPRKGVLDLFSLSNLFICPSYSESFGLTVLEAASRGNFLVLNKNVPALEELGFKLNAYMMAWDGKQFEREYKVKYVKTEKDYYETEAKKIIEYMNQERALVAKNKIRLNYSYEWIWKNQLAPLLFM